MNYFPIEVEITETKAGWKSGEKYIWTNTDRIPDGVSFKVLKTKVKVEPKEFTKRDKFICTYFAKKMLEKHSLDEYGLWLIKGEDPNCDLGGHHYQPNLGTVEGVLSDVIDYAVELPQFWQWGAGGEITKVITKKI